MLRACLVFLFCLLAVTAHAQGVSDPEMSMELKVEGLIKSLILYLARFVEVGAALVIGIASLRCLGSYFWNLI